MEESKEGLIKRLEKISSDGISRVSPRSLISTKYRENCFYDNASLIRQYTLPCRKVQNEVKTFCISYCSKCGLIYIMPVSDIEQKEIDSASKMSIKSLIKRL